MTNEEYQKQYREQHRDELLQYHRQYYQDHKEEFREKGKEYRQKNSEAVRARKLAYYSDPDVKARKKIKEAARYVAKRDMLLARQRARRKERKAFIDAVSLKYGCQNPGCEWGGKLESYQLDFHHLDPKLKEIEVAKMCSWSFDKIVAEINKCVVLCRNCHPKADRGLVAINEFHLCKEEVSVDKPKVEVVSVEELCEGTGEPVSECQCNVCRDADQSRVGWRRRRGDREGGLR